MAEPICVYCHQGGDPEHGYTRTCPACHRVYLARFPRDEQQQRASGACPATRPATVSDVRHAVPALTHFMPPPPKPDPQGSLF